MKIALRLAASLLLTLAASVCDGRDEKAYIVRSGTSFGMCRGYCEKQIEISGSNLIFSSRSRAAGAPLKFEQEQLEPSEVEALGELLSRASIGGQPRTFGCPDCADGGAEWIEVQNGTDPPVRVTFELGNPPRELAPLEQYLMLIKRRFTRGSLP